MTTNQYLTTVKEKYPNTYIGFLAHIKNTSSNSTIFLKNITSYPLDYVLSYFVLYIEYRNVNFLEALCNTHIDNIQDAHEMLRLKTVTHILNRLEKFINPAEGQTF